MINGEDSVEAADVSELAVDVAGQDFAAIATEKFQGFSGFGRVHDTGLTVRFEKVTKEERERDFQREGGGED